MKLFLTWLLGVPVLVTFMVLTQSLLMKDQNAAAGTHADPVSCSGQRHANDMSPLIPNQAYHISCDQLTIH
jgi:hypothetical protein